jgi:hypothetical protein
MTYLIDTNTFRKFGLAALAAALLAVHGAQAEAPTNPGVVAVVAPAPVAVSPAPVVSRKSAAPAVAHARLARQSGIGLVLGVGF